MVCSIALFLIVKSESNEHPFGDKGVVVVVVRIGCSFTLRFGLLNCVIMIYQRLCGIARCSDL